MPFYRDKAEEEAHNEGNKTHTRVQPSGEEQPMLFLTATFSAVTSSMGAGDDATKD